MLHNLCRSYWLPNRRYHRTKWMPWWQPDCLKYPLEWMCCLVLEFYKNNPRAITFRRKYWFKYQISFLEFNLGFWEVHWLTYSTSYGQKRSVLLANSFRLSHFEPRQGQSQSHSGHFIDGNPVISFNFQRVSKFLPVEILFIFYLSDKIGTSF